MKLELRPIRGQRRGGPAMLFPEVPMGLAVTVEELQALLSHENAFTRPFGFRVESVEDGICTLDVPFQPAWERPGGIVSGIVFMTAADVAMWLAIKTQSGLADPSVTSHMQTSFLRSARSEGLDRKS